MHTSVEWVMNNVSTVELAAWNKYYIYKGELARRKQN